MTDVSDYQAPIDGEIVTHGVADRTVAFFIALGDPAVDKNWADLGKTMLVVAPAVAALIATRGKRKKSIRGLIAPGIALGKLVAEVNKQVTPAHLNRAHDYVNQAKVHVTDLREQAVAAASKRRHSQQPETD